MTDLDDIREALAAPLCLVPLPRYACLCQHPVGHPGEHSADQPPGVRMLRRAMVEVDRLAKERDAARKLATAKAADVDRLTALLAAETERALVLEGERDALRAQLAAAKATIARLTWLAH